MIVMPFMITFMIVVIIMNYFCKCYVYGCYDFYEKYDLYEKYDFYHCHVFSECYDWYYFYDSTGMNVMT